MATASKSFVDEDESLPTMCVTFQLPFMCAFRNKNNRTFHFFAVEHLVITFDPQSPDGMTDFYSRLLSEDGSNAVSESYGGKTFNHMFTDYPDGAIPGKAVPEELFKEIMQEMLLDCYDFAIKTSRAYMKDKKIEHDTRRVMVHHEYIREHGRDDLYRKVSQAFEGTTRRKLSNISRIVLKQEGKGDISFYGI